MAVLTLTPDRPRDESLAAIRAALTSVVDDVRSARARLDRARSDAAAAVVTGDEPAIRRTRAGVEAAERALRQFQDMRLQMAARLARAEAAEAPASPARSAVESS